MQGSLRLTIHHPLPFRPFPTVSASTKRSVAQQQSESPALARLFATLITRPQARLCLAISRVNCYCQQRAIYINRASPPSELPAWRKHGVLGQVRLQHEKALTRDYWEKGTPGTPGTSGVQGTQQDANNEIQVNDVTTWETMCATLQKKHGDEGIWTVFQTLMEEDKILLLKCENAESLRNAILSASVSSELRLKALFDVALQLSAEEGFKWPGLYMRVIHFFLRHSRFEEAIRWHLQLAPVFLPSIETLGTLLASFVTNPTPKMQSTITSLYVLSFERKFYDYLIPTLYASGQSTLARSWRKKLILLQDFPTSAQSRPFLRFLSSYFPSIELTRKELVASGLDVCCDSTNVDTVDKSDTSSNDDELIEGLYSDSIVANWFASTWISVEFAINLVHRLGVRRIGPRSLQSLALRASNTKDVTTCLDQLENLSIEISPRIYCQVLISFARKGEDELLTNLIHCDIHPDEFEDMETRQLLMAEATRTGNWKNQHLFQSIEWLVDTGPTSWRLNTLLRTELSKHSLSRARAVLDRMEALNVDMTQHSANRLLQRVFWKLDSHPQGRQQRSLTRELTMQVSNDPVLDRAIEVTRRIAYHNMAVPVHYWKILLLNLGRTGRLDELEQLCLEIVRLYSPQSGGLIPIHRVDLPSKTEHEKEYIPADLPFQHHCHPIRKIFDVSLQRSVVRWGFDQTLAAHPQGRTSSSHLKYDSFVVFDVARGVRLLATVRDQGVLIDAQVLRSTLLSRISMISVPGRPKHNSRDSIELSIQHVKSLVEEAWGTDILPHVPDIIQEMQTRKPRLWSRYPRLFAKSYKWSQ